MAENIAIDNNVIISLKEIMGDQFNLLISTFVDDTGQLIHSLTELQKQDDIEVFTRNSHSIKSSSANLGAVQLSLIAAELEAQGKTGDISNTINKINILVTEFDNVCAELKAIS